MKRFNVKVGDILKLDGMLFIVGYIKSGNRFAQLCHPVYGRATWHDFDIGYIEHDERWSKVEI